MKGEPPAALLDARQSAALREKLLVEVANIPSVDLAAGWAHAALAAKNSLTAADAKLLEDAFEQRLSILPSSWTTVPSPDDTPATEIVGRQTPVTPGGSDPARAKRIDKSVLALAAPRRYRNREHLRYVSRQPCLVCGRKPSDPHHLRYVQPRALGRKVSDEFAVPLCRMHHRSAHRVGDERAWWNKARIDPIKVARNLWKETRVNKEQGRAGSIEKSPAERSEDRRPRNSGFEMKSDR